MGKRTPAPRWHACNVFHCLPNVGRLWRFAVNNESVSLSAHHEFNLGQPIPPKTIQRGWMELWRPKLNVAWLPADRVHLRVIHLPKGEPEELGPMLELQLEKISPAPVNQVVWTYQPVPHPDPNQQSVIVIIADRSSVEHYLGQLEQQGYLADRLELPWLHHVLGDRPSTNQTCLYLIARDQQLLCLSAWWYDGILQHLDLFHIDYNESAPARFVDQIVRVAWAGEIEGWLTTTPRWRLTAAGVDREAWTQRLREPLGGDLESESVPELVDLAQLAARRSIRGESTANLMPPEALARYRQQFVDRLWMRGLGALIVVYLFGVLLYFAAVQVGEHQESRLRAQLAALSGSYTNALQLREQVRIFSEQSKLKYAALHSLRVASSLLPPELMLTSFTFQGGRSLRLVGTVAPDQQSKVTEYNDDLRNATVDGTHLFDKPKVEAPRLLQQGNVVRWDFTADLNRAFTE